MAVNFFSEDTDFELKGKREISQWIKQVASEHQRKIGEINYIFCNDDYLLDLNQEHLQHDTYTDIITFDYSSDGVIEGDIYISVERVAENAQQFQQSFERELKRVMIHGILHLIGFKDKTESDQATMRSHEDRYLNSINH